jgi:RsiW-degrading membrane proteinase PrsW (M82 family)
MPIAATHLHLQTSPRETHFYSEKRVDAVVNAIILFMLVVLELPLGVIEYKLTSSGGNVFTVTKSIVLGTFTLLFASSMIYFTKLRLRKILVASLSYFVVMFVFMVGIQKAAKRER